MAKIPKILLSVWFGGMLPQRYQQNMIQLRKLNPDYQVLLYTDSSTMQEQDFEALKQFCSISDLTIKDAQELSYPNIDLIHKELQLAKIQADETIKKIHYVRASDLIRMLALYRHGGIYIDTDIEPHRGFGDLASSTGILTTSYNPANKNPQGKWYYDLIATVPKKRLFEEALYLHRIDELLLNTLLDNPILKPTSSRKALKAYVLATTGSLLFYGLSFHHLIHRDELQAGEDVLVAGQFVQRKNDNSWLPQAFTELTQDESEFVDMLMKCLQQERRVIFALLGEPILDFIYNYISASVKPAYSCSGHQPKLIFRDEIPRPYRSKLNLIQFGPPNPANRKYAHRYGFFGQLSPFNLARNLSNGVRWNATTSERTDTVCWEKFKKEN